ncbi:MAG: GMC oxidoreductase [Planctomycetota bacterium]
MIRDLNTTDGELPEYDVCIVGSGPAGLILAAELAAPGAPGAHGSANSANSSGSSGDASRPALRICVLESGRQRVTSHADALRAVRSEGITIKDYSRERVLGGASTTWAGLSAPLDPIDLLPRAVLPPHAAWPISREELLADWARAAARYRFAPLAHFGAQGFGALKARGDAQLAWQRMEEKIFMACAEPQNFGRELRELCEGPAVDLWLDATVLRLEASPLAQPAAPGPTAALAAPPAAPAIRQAIVRTRGGRQLALRARYFVLATGGLENARLLLNSTDLCAAGLGNEHDQVGRWLMNHPKNYGGVIQLARPVRDLPYHFGCLHKGYAGYAGLRLSESEQRARGLLNCYVRFEPLFPWSDNRGVEAFVFLVKRSGGLFRRWKAARQDRVVAMRDYSESGDDSDLQNERKSAWDWVKLAGLVLRHAPMVARYVAARLREGRSPTVRAVRLRNFLEMEPRAENRVQLAEERDAYGQRLPLVRHESSERDRRSLLALHEALAEDLRRNGFGELRTDLAAHLTEPSGLGGAAGAANSRSAAGGVRGWPIDQDASHHLGTTRMGTDPATSVVDPSLRVHSTNNVYLAGGSVFPTSGCANPTFTIAALSIRLARHLRQRLGLPPAAHDEEAAPSALGTKPPPRRQPRPDARRVLVLGAGRRVQEDVLPTLLWLEDRFVLAGVCARRARSLSIGGRELAVRAFDALDAKTLAGVDLLYCAVTKEAVPGVLARLAELARSGAFDPRRVDLILDTPVLLLKHLRHARRLRVYRHVWVAEDTATLPWLGLALRAFTTDGSLDNNAVRTGASSAGLDNNVVTVDGSADAGAGGSSAPGLRGPKLGPKPGPRPESEAGPDLGRLQRVVIDRSAWRYHAVALARVLARGGAPVGAPLGAPVGTPTRLLSARRRTAGGARIVELSFAGGLQAEIHEPRDFARGRWALVGERGALVDGEHAEGGAGVAGVAPAQVRARLQLIVEGGRCRGFRLAAPGSAGALTAMLSADESELLGPVRPSDTVTTLMPELKRVGLARLLCSVHEGRGAYPLTDGLEDMFVDAIVEKTRRWRDTPLTSLRRGPWRALAGLSRLRV